MSNTSIKVAFVIFVVLATPAASFAQGGEGAGARGGGSATTGQVGGSRPNNAAIGAQQMLTDPSGIGNASKVAPIAPPRISVPTVPQFK
jgi:hypothetical protein